MRKIITRLFVLLSLAVLLYAGNIANAGIVQSNNQIIYRVQILALKQPLSVKSIKVHGVKGKVYVTKDTDFTRYSIGQFHDLKSAIDFRDQLIKTGLQDACVVAYKNDTRITIKESLALLGQSK